MRGMLAVIRSLVFAGLMTAALGAQAEAQVCTSGSCIQLTNHIASNKIPFGSSTSTAATVFVGAASVAGGKFVAICNSATGSVVLPTNQHGSWIQLNSNNSLSADLSLCLPTASASRT